MRDKYGKYQLVILLLFVNLPLHFSHNILKYMNNPKFIDGNIWSDDQMVANLS